MLEFVAELAVEILNALGYGGLFFLMAAESMILPVPSEAVMPFAGFLVARGQMSFIVAAAAALLGTIAGSLLSYWLGLLGGRAFIRRYGRFFLLEEAHLEWTERWFARYGEKTVFLARFVPVVRHLISIPCGLARMRYGKFLFFTAAGGFLWNTFLLWLGVKMGEQWGIIRAWGRTADIIFVGALVAGVLLFIRHRRADRAALARRRAD